LYLQDPEDLQDMMNDVFRQGLEGLVLKDIKVRWIPTLIIWFIINDLIHKTS